MIVLRLRRERGPQRRHTAKRVREAMKVGHCGKRWHGTRRRKPRAESDLNTVQVMRNAIVPPAASQLSAELKVMTVEMSLSIPPE